MIQRAYKGIVLVGVQNKEALIDQDIYGIPARAIEHKFAEGFAHRGRRTVDELLGLLWDANVNISAALLLPRS